MRERVHGLDLIARRGDGTREIRRIRVDARIGVAPHLARHASRLEPEERLARTRMTEKGRDLVAGPEHQHLATPAHPRARDEALPFQDRARARRLAAWRTELEEIARRTGGDGAAGKEQAAQVRSTAALTPQRRTTADELRTMDQPSCGCTEVLRARQQCGQHTAVAVGWAKPRQLGLDLLGQR